MSIYSDFTTLINITSLDGVVSYHKGYNNNAPDNYYVTITVPSNISSVKVNEQEINLDSPELSIVLPDGQTKSSGSMFFAALAPTLPLASWNFDEASGISAIDLIGSNNGTISNATRTDGVLNRALEFNGSSSYVTIPSNPDLATVEAITVMAWVYPQQNKTSKVFYKGNWKGFNSIGQDVWKGWNCEIALANNLMSPVSGFGVNVVKENPYVEPVSLDVHITFNEHKYTIDNLNMSEFNPFIFIEGDRAREVHLADFPPTKSASTALFGKEEDTSNPGIGRYYKTASNLPWAINLFSGFDHVVERIEITDAYLKFAAWAGSAGVEFPDWYLDKAGYRLSQNIY